MPGLSLRDDALAIWQHALQAVRPQDLVREALRADPEFATPNTGRLIVVGAGKAGASMAAGLEEAWADRLDRVEGLVNVPAGCVRPLQKIRLHAARPDGSNHPTAEGVLGTREMLDRLASAGPNDRAICLLSGGGSALLPAPADGITLDDKQAVTRLLHASGATINEMNAVRKHLSRVKGGGLASAFRGQAMLTLIISDVIGDPLDVIASGPTAADPTTYADAIAVLRRFDLWERVPEAVRSHLTQAAVETLKQQPAHVINRIIGRNADALRAAAERAESLGYRVVSLGAFVEGETREVARAFAGMLRSIRADATPTAAPACLLMGGETTVTLGREPGRGGRNQEFALATALALGTTGLTGMAVLSAGTDGEDGPTDAAGAVVDERIWLRAEQLGVDPRLALDRHDAYPLLDALGDLIRTGPTHNNVMDVRLGLVAG